MNAPYWFPVVTLVVGALAGYFADYLRETRASSRQREEARRSFQHETLLELQDRCADLARATSKGFHDDRTEYEKSKTWGRGQISDEADEGAHESIRNIHRLRVRLSDRDLSRFAEQFIEICSTILMPLPRSAGDDLQVARAVESRYTTDFPEQFEALNERLGEALQKVL